MSIKLVIKYCIYSRWIIRSIWRRVGGIPAAVTREETVSVCVQPWQPTSRNVMTMGCTSSGGHQESAVGDLEFCYENNFPRIFLEAL